MSSLTPLSRHFVSNYEQLTYEMAHLDGLTEDRNIILKVDWVDEMKYVVGKGYKYTKVLLTDSEDKALAIFQSNDKKKHVQLKCDTIIQLKDWKFKWYNKTVYFKNYEIFECPPNKNQSETLLNDIPIKYFRYISCYFCPAVEKLVRKIDEYNYWFLPPNPILKIVKLQGLKVEVGDDKFNMKVYLSDGFKCINAMFRSKDKKKHVRLKAKKVIQIMQWKMKWRDDTLYFKNYEYWNNEPTQQPSDEKYQIDVCKSTQITHKPPPTKRIRREPLGEDNKITTKTTGQPLAQHQRVDNIYNIFEKLQMAMPKCIRSVLWKKDMSNKLHFKLQHDLLKAEIHISDLLKACTKTNIYIQEEKTDLPITFLHFANALKHELNRARSTYTLIQSPTYINRKKGICQMIEVEKTYSHLLNSFKYYTRTYIHQQIDFILLKTIPKIPHGLVVHYTTHANKYQKISMDTAWKTQMNQMLNYLEVALPQCLTMILHNTTLTDTLKATLNCQIDNTEQLFTKILKLCTRIHKYHNTKKQHMPQKLNFFEKALLNQIHTARSIYLRQLTLPPTTELFDQMLQLQQTTCDLLHNFRFYIYNQLKL